MYTHASLVEFVEQWVPSTPFPILLVRIIYEFTEYIKKRVRVDIDELTEILEQNGYVVDRESMSLLNM